MELSLQSPFVCLSWLLIKHGDFYCETECCWQAVVSPAMLTSGVGCLYCRFPSLGHPPPSGLTQTVHAFE
jgi:hypothetical protein